MIGSARLPEWNLSIAKAGWSMREQGWFRKAVLGGIGCSAAFWLLSLPVSAGPPSCEGDESFAQVSISVDHGAKKITVSPDEVTIYLDDSDGPGMVCWVVANLAEKTTLHIADKEGQEGYFPSAAWRLTKAGNIAGSGRPSKAGRWEYKLRVTEGGESLYSLDPTVIIEGGGGAVTPEG